MRTIAFHIACALFILFVYSCALTQSSGIYATGVVDRAEIRGEYNVVLYGNRYGDDVETIAVLDIVDDAYTFKPHAPDYDFMIRKSVASDVAVSEALRFISRHTDYRTSRIRSITLNGSTIGYEVKPLYHRHRYGQSDITYVSYYSEDKSVKIHIRLKSAVERILRKRDSSN